MPGAETAGGYGPLEAPARNKVKVKKVLTAWPDMLRVAGSLVTNQVRAYDLLRMIGRDICHARRAPSTRRTGTGRRTSSAHSAWS